MKKAMQIVMKKVDELIRYENNPRRNEGAIHYVANSIEEFNFKVPILIDKNNVIVAGHTRLEAAITLGYEEVLIHSDLKTEVERQSERENTELLTKTVITICSLQQTKKICFLCFTLILLFQ